MVKQSRLHVNEPGGLEEEGCLPLLKKFPLKNFKKFGEGIFHLLANFHKSEGKSSGFLSGSSDVLFADNSNVNTK